MSTGTGAAPLSVVADGAAPYTTVPAKWPPGEARSAGRRAFRRGPEDDATPSARAPPPRGARPTAGDTSARCPYLIGTGTGRTGVFRDVPYTGRAALWMAA
ncbi:hypothetical protein [Streptomyces sp. NPDC058108]|uniref:hypothetical protein n=1 Tax=Streptomyces sp. NPDC058108 TaxID=3346344 RepID=UPI0036E9D7F6